jgi:N-carbamoylputrescine amidase
VKAALVVNHVCPDVDANMRTILNMASQAADRGAELVLFPEAAPTGLINNDDPAHDLPFGQPIPGPVTESLAKLCRQRRLWLGMGLLERVDGKLYDSAVLLGPEGRIELKYQRIHPGWYDPEVHPGVYCRGTELNKAETPLGSFAFLICGDLFDDELVQRMQDLAPDWLLFPFARAFDDGSHEQARWDEQERPEYVQRIKLVGVTTLMVNYLASQDLPDGGSFGGAMVVSGGGTVLERFPLGQPGILVFDL